MTQAVDWSALEAAIPAQLRDPAGHWFGLTMRARIVCASKERVGRDATSYEELADPKWKGKLCMRSGRHVYNTSLFATLIAHNGEAATEAWLRGVKANLAHKPAGGDREQARDIYSGKCDIALGNTSTWRCGQEREEPGAASLGQGHPPAVWGRLKPDALPLENIANFRKKACELVDKVNFDVGPSS